MHLDPDGFLAEPQVAQFYSVNLNLKTLEQLDFVCCLLLLGDPALGKSWDLGEYAEYLSDRIRESSAMREESNHDVLIAFDATEFDSTQDFRERVFANDAISHWKRGRGILYLIIDSVDEARMDNERFSSALLDELESLPIDRLRLRLACRTAVVPPTLRQGLRLKFRSQETRTSAGPQNSDDAAGAGPRHGREVSSNGQHSNSTAASGDAPVLAEISPTETTAPSEYYAEYELAILTRGQARALVVAELTSEEAADQFFAAINLVDAHVGATRPQTLRSLISRYAAGQSLEGSQVELFRSLCLTLCTPCPIQPDAYHRDGSVLSQRERYRVASRIASAMQLGNRPILSLNPRPVDQDGVLDVPALTGLEQVEGGTLRIRETELWEAVNTGLFTATTTETALAAHLTFGEFLTADWLTANDLPLAQVIPLLTDPNDPERRVVPQLRQVAAWLSAMRADVFERIARAEPDILLWSDVVQMPATRRPAMVTALLEGTTANRILNPPFGMSGRLEHLSHPDLARQLEPIITNRQLPERTRDLAFDIAIASSESALCDAAVCVALDHAESLAVRKLAAHLVAKAGNDEQRWQLMELAADAPPEDEVDDLKGAALEASWRLFTPDELFGIVARPKRPNYSGYYGLALREIADALTSEYAAAGASWLAQESRGGISYDFLAVRVLRLALEQSEDPGVLAALAGYAAQRALHFESISEHLDVSGDLGIRDLLRDDALLRRRLITAVIDLSRDIRDKLYLFIHHPPPLFNPADASWAVEQLAALPPGDDRRQAWRELIRFVFVDDPEALAIAFAHRDDPDVDVSFGGLLSQYDTPEVALAAISLRLQQNQERLQELVRRNAERDAERAARLDRASAGTLALRIRQAMVRSKELTEKWELACWELLRRGPREFSSSLDETRLAALRSLRNTSLGARLLKAAEAFLEYADAPEEPYPDHQVLWAAVRGVLAALAVQELDSERMKRLPPEAWARWIPSIVGYLPGSGQEDAHQQLLACVANLTPAAAREAFIRLLDKEATSARGWFPGYVLEIVLTVPGVTEEITRRVARSEYDPFATGRLLDFLLKTDSTTVVAAAKKLFRVLVRSAVGRGNNAVKRERALAAATALMNHVPEVSVL